MEPAALDHPREVTEAGTRGLGRACEGIRMSGLVLVAIIITLGGIGQRRWSHGGIAHDRSVYVQQSRSCRHMENWGPSSLASVRVLDPSQFHARLLRSCQNNMRYRLSRSVACVSSLAYRILSCGSGEGLNSSDLYLRALRRWLALDYIYSPLSLASSRSIISIASSFLAYASLAYASLAYASLAYASSTDEYELFFASLACTSASVALEISPRFSFLANMSTIVEKELCSRCASAIQDVTDKPLMRFEVDEDVEACGSERYLLAPSGGCDPLWIFAYCTFTGISLFLVYVVLWMLFVGFSDRPSDAPAKSG